MAVQTTLASEGDYAAWASARGLEAVSTGLAPALAAATKELQQFCGRDFRPSPATLGETEVRSYVGDGGKLLFIADALTIVSVTCLGAPVTDFRADPPGETPTQWLTRPVVEFINSAYPLYGPYTWAQGQEVTVVGRFGYCEIADLPADLVEACCALAAVRVLSGADWTNVGITEKRVAEVIVKFDNGAGMAGKRADALALARPYRRLFP
jgi:hypothetical protein